MVHDDGLRSGLLVRFANLRRLLMLLTLPAAARGSASASSSRCYKEAHAHACLRRGVPALGATRTPHLLYGVHHPGPRDWTLEVEARIVAVMLVVAWFRIGRPPGGQGYERADACLKHREAMVFGGNAITCCFDRFDAMRILEGPVIGGCRRSDSHETVSETCRRAGSCGTVWKRNLNLSGGPLQPSTAVLLQLVSMARARHDEGAGPGPSDPCSASESCIFPCVCCMYLAASDAAAPCILRSFAVCTEFSDLRTRRGRW